MLKNYNTIEDSKDFVGDLFDLIVCVVAGNNPRNEIEYLTKGDYSTIDIDRLFSTTDANIKTIIGKHKCICAMVAKEINCKIISIDWQEVLEILRIKLETKDAIVESFDKYLEDECKLKLGKTKEQMERLRSISLTNSILGLPYKRKKVNTTGRQEAFDAILKLSKTNDSQINKKICEALKEDKLIHVGRVEEDFGDIYSVRSDMICSIPGKYVRVEFMWRDTASAANISSYTLEKLYGYCHLNSRRNYT